jgi:uncharacterized protein YacL
LNLIRVMPAKGQDAMQRSTYLARLIGPIFIAIALGMLLNGQTYRMMAQQAVNNYTLIYISGLLTLTAGIALVLAHNVWTPDWRLIVTVIGWLGVVGGTFRIVWPQLVAQMANGMLMSRELPIVAGVVVLVLGAILSYFGYSEFFQTSRRSRRKRS